MMYQQVIARRYAKGLMMAAAVEDLDTIDEQFSELIAVLADENADLARLFSDPAFSPSEKKAVINQICTRYKINEVFCHFLLLLVDKGRLLLLPLIHEGFVALLDEHHGRMRAHIKSAVPVDDVMVKDITAALKKICKKEILADVAIDRGLLAGLRVELGGMVIDGSAKAKLAAMKNQLVNSIEAVSV
jgi:F-type H+-transporting ATPase subunit delta